MTNLPHPTLPPPRRPRPTGQGLVEFALILPVMLLLILGVIEGGRMMAIFSSVSNASRQAARYGSVTGFTNGGSGTQFYKDCDGIVATAQRSSPLQPLGVSNISIYYDDGDGTVLGTCDPATDTVTATIPNGSRIVVKIVTTYTVLVPLLPLPAMPLTFTSARSVFSTINGPTPTASCPGTYTSPHATTSDAQTNPAYPGIDTRNANGTDFGTLNIELKEAGGCALDSGVKITVTASSAGSSLDGTAVDTVTSWTTTTDSQGTASVDITSLTPGIYTYTIKAGVPAVTLNDRPAMRFISGTTPYLTLVLAETVIPVDSSVVATVTVYDATNTPDDGVLVELSSSEVDDTISPSSGTSDVNGQVVFTISPKAGDIGARTILAKSTGYTTKSATLTTSGVDPTLSTVRVYTDTITASTGTGNDWSIITVTLKSSSGTPVSDQEVTLVKTTGAGTPSISPLDAKTNSDGIMRFKVFGTTAGTYGFSATVTAESLILDELAIVTIKAGALNSLAVTSPATGTTMLPGSNQSFTAVGYDQFLNTISGTDLDAYGLTWSSSALSGSSFSDGTGSDALLTVGTVSPQLNKDITVSTAGAITAKVRVNINCLSSSTLVQGINAYFNITNTSGVAVRVDQIVITSFVKNGGPTTSMLENINLDSYSGENNAIWTTPDFSAVPKTIESTGYLWGTGSRVIPGGASRQLVFDFNTDTKSLSTMVKLVINDTGVTSCYISK